MNNQVESRGFWSSFMGLILACVGSAVGLGNLWKFPYITFKYGGGAFVFVYLLSLAIICFPIFLTEMFLGRQCKTNVFSAIKELSNNSVPWKGMAILCLFTSAAILSFYSVVAGWTFDYLFESLRGGLLHLNTQNVETSFGHFLENGPVQVFIQFLALFITGAVVAGGTKGIERASIVLMPLLFAFILLLTIFSTTSYGFSESFWFLFHFDFSKLTPQAVLEAMGHAFFTMSTGLGVILIYGSYVPQKINLVKASILVAILDTLVGLFACFMIYPIIFHGNMDVQESSAILFTSLTLQFNDLPYSQVFSSLFYLLLAVAAISSTISMLELLVSFAQETTGMSRKKATLTCLLILWPVAIACALSNGASQLFSSIGAMEILDKITTNWTLPLGGICFSILCGWKVSKEIKVKSFLPEFFAPWAYHVWIFLLKFIVPVLVLLVMLFQLGIIK